MPIPLDMHVDASTGSVIVAPMADDAAAEWQAFANPPLEDAKAPQARGARHSALAGRTVRDRGRQPADRDG